MSLYFSKYPTLSKYFMLNLEELIQKEGEEMARLNGFSDSQLNKTDFIDNFIEKSTVADASVDGNANVSHKDIVTLMGEMPKAEQKLLGFNKIFYEIQKKYGYETAVQWLTHEYDGHLYMHDAASVSFIPYCFAYDLTDLVNRGLYFISGFNSQPPKHLDTFVQFVEEFISWNCNRTSGAVGLPDFLIYAFYFWKKDVEEGYYMRSPEYWRDQNFQKFIYKINEPSMRGKTQSAFTNMSIYDTEYLMSLFGGKQYPDGSYVVEYYEEIIEFQKAFMRMVSSIRSQNMFTFPVLTFSLLYKDGQFVDEQFAKWACKHNMKWADSNFFVSEDVTSLSNCCRLKSNIEQLGYFNSIGGTALKVGSVKVSTVNLARLAYESASREEYLGRLEQEVILDLKALDVVRSIMKRNVEKELLPNYSLGVIDMKAQYNTIGIIGLYEALQKFGFTEKDEFGYTTYTEDGKNFAVAILNKINEVKDAFAADKDYMINVEQIPGESAAEKLMKKDKHFFGGKFAFELPLYGNQWIPLAVRTSMEEKIQLSALLDKACNGGGIAHFNIDAPFKDFDTAWKLLNHIAESGVNYFAFNVRISACEHNHGFYGEVCPECGGHKVTTYQRIVGFLVPTVTYSETRKKEFEMRKWAEKADLPVLAE